MVRYLSRLLLLVLPLLLVLATATPVLAIANPDSIAINSVRAYEGLWEAGDMLFVVEYEVMYDPDPEEDPQDTFLAGIWDGAVKGPDRPLDYYQHNFTSIYLTAAEATSFGYEINDELKVRVTGNPSYFPTLVEGTNMSTVTMTAGHWLGGGTLQETRDYLANWCIVLAGVLEDSWDIPLLSSADKLNSAGRLKFLEAIPGLDGICPDIFLVSASYPGYEEPDYDPAYEEDLKGRVGAKLLSILDNLGKWVTGKENLGSLVGGVGLAVLFFILAGRIFIATGSVPTAIVVSLPFLFAGNLIGILPLSITFIAAFLVSVMFAITFILGRL